MEAKRILLKGPNNLREYVSGIVLIATTVLVAGIVLASTFLLVQGETKSPDSNYYVFVPLIFLTGAGLFSVPFFKFKPELRIRALVYMIIFLAFEFSPAFIEGKIQIFALCIGCTLIAMATLIWLGTKLTDEKYRDMIRKIGIVTQVGMIAIFTLQSSMATNAIFIVALLTLVRYGFEFSEFKTRDDMIAWAAALSFEGGIFLVYALRLFGGISLI